MNSILNFVLSLAEKPLLTEGGKFLEKNLDSFYEKNPKVCIALVSSAYTWLDTVVEDYVKTTNNTIDDDAVAEVKRDLEDFASRHNFTLQNLDTD